MPMFCHQCQETAKNTGCTIQGVCGKKEEVANLQDLFIWTLKGISVWGVKGKEFDIYDEAIGFFITSVGSQQRSFPQGIPNADSMLGCRGKLFTLGFHLAFIC